MHEGRSRDHERRSVSWCHPFGPLPSRSGSRRSPSFRSDRGQVLPLMAVVVLLAVSVCVGVVRLGAGVADRARARTAADAAALAGARDGEDLAAQVAQDNHGELLAYVASHGEVEVSVRVGDASATSRAARQW